MSRSPWTDSLRRSACAIVMTIAVAGLAAAPALAQDRALYLDVTINGQKQDLIGGFVERDGTLYATPEELQAVGVRPPEGGLTGDGLVSLAGISGLHYDYDEPGQALTITLPESARQPIVIGARDKRVTQSDSDYGVLLNYDLLGTRSDDSTSGSGLFEGRVFGPLGVLDSS